MSNNRTEVKAFIQANIQPLMVTAVHRETIDDNFAEGAVFKKDVSATVTGTTPTANFTNNDQVVINTTGANTTITITGLEDGQRGKLIVEKGSLNTVDFTGISGTIDGQVLGRTVLHYDVWSANGKIYLTNVNCQSDGTLEGSDVSFSVANVNNIYLRYVINNNMIHVNGSYDNFGTPSDKITITINSRVFGYFFDPTILPDMSLQSWAKKYPINIGGFDTNDWRSGFGTVEDNGSSYIIFINVENFITTSRQMNFSFSVPLK